MYKVLSIKFYICEISNIIPPRVARGVKSSE